MGNMEDMNGGAVRGEKDEKGESEIPRSSFHKREFASFSSGISQRPTIHWDRRGGVSRVEHNIVEW